MEEALATRYNNHFYDILPDDHWFCIMELYTAVCERLGGINKHEHEHESAQDARERHFLCDPQLSSITLSSIRNVTSYGEINGNTLRGVLSLPRDQHRNITKEMAVRMCKSMRMCVGFSMHPTAGVFLHTKECYPLQHVRDWTFFIKDRVREKMEPKEKTEPETLIVVDKQSWLYPNYTSSNVLQEFPNANVSKYYLSKLPMKVPMIPRKYISFEWNYGRTNNQIMSFEAMLQYCVIYQRAIILPFGSHFNHFQGVFADGLWDMLKLSQLCDFVYEFEFQPPSNDQLVNVKVHHLWFREFTQTKIFDQMIPCFAYLYICI
ncbi:hypothetical protein RFI_05994 [Reticulomyxa filosa]|uniref:Uncharacterized protein n=1 Tax=Reticulomyxa filosa TaxID=46433 RepID=X6NYR0_RETFI|nr:hypothetical protein RFI_05994 [Reticulomyxa filosa]|eukprot:ETO31126.1 hypothetical protein RFI_05994 [Reticulomyxa filosa]